MENYEVTRTSITPLFSTIILALSLSACGGNTSSGATCPSSSTLTYAAFGQGFMTRYCTGCHGDMASATGVRAKIAAIDERAAAGPNGINSSMPKSGAVPSDDERTKLGQWLACGAP
jgi:hypothetical protein